MVFKEGFVLEEKHGGIRRNEGRANIINIYCIKITIFNERKIKTKKV